MKNIIKKISLFVFVAALVFTLIGCSFNNKEPEKEDHAPLFHGVEDVTIEKGASFKPLEGVSVTDEEDGNINVSLVKVDASSVNVNVDVIGNNKSTDINRTIDLLSHANKNSTANINNISENNINNNINDNIIK